jgi:hypothetical protein
MTGPIDALDSLLSRNALRLLVYALVVGAAATALGILAATFVRYKSPSFMWAATTSCVAVAGGLAAGPLFYLQDKRRDQK